MHKHRTPLPNELCGDGGASPPSPEPARATAGVLPPRHLDALLSSVFDPAAGAVERARDAAVGCKNLLATTRPLRAGVRFDSSESSMPTKQLR